MATLGNKVKWGSRQIPHSGLTRPGKYVVGHKLDRISLPDFTRVSYLHPKRSSPMYFDIMSTKKKRVSFTTDLAKVLLSTERLGF